MEKQFELVTPCFFGWGRNAEGRNQCYDLVHYAFKHSNMFELKKLKQLVSQTVCLGTTAGDLYLLFSRWVTVTGRTADNGVYYSISVRETEFYQSPRRE